MDATAMYSAPAPAPKTLTYTTAVLKGHKLLALMRSRIPAPGSGQFVPGDLEKHGYGLLRYGCDETIDTFSQMLREMGTDVCVRAEEDNGKGGDNIDMMHFLQRAVEINGVHIPSMHANFGSVMNIRAGMIVATNNHAPRVLPGTENPPPLPILRHWSDVAFLQWCLLPSFGLSIPPLNYVLRAGIENQDTIAVISSVLGYSAAVYSIDDGPQVRMAWPGRTIPMDNLDAVALIGTPNGSGVAWLLAQHKAELGHLVVKQVSIFFTVDDGGLEKPNLLFWIEEVVRPSSLLSKM
ncbi:hypothetical protein HBH70_159730 [Parastagonospora nodorum]|nr:hypothetical protein HBH52_235800 [Parastagonospora nodorum]KAH4925514.1 hypothetical protein HBH74_114040 [Parastagonospora nodorum]KAH4941613.1 hypothetical protein HBH73_156730 [Parastagonospora nodorum]KAH4981152.1 hypothetical protein HBI76_173530 [Parastagonospora nodorum]KAH5132386.1 hypothetical protein HBH70_159730 [Parastagonospora nodorum]